MNAKGTRGFGPDGHFELREARSVEEVHAALLGLGFDDLQLEPYGASEVASFRVWGFVERDAAQLLKILDAVSPLGLRRFELGLRGHLRAADGRMEWMPWRKNAFLNDISDFDGEAGVRHIFTVGESA